MLIVIFSNSVKPIALSSSQHLYNIRVDGNTLSKYCPGEEFAYRQRRDVCFGAPGGDLSFSAEGGLGGSKGRSNYSYSVNDLGREGSRLQRGQLPKGVHLRRASLKEDS